MAIAYLNLDNSNAQTTVQNCLQQSSESNNLQELTENYDKLLNLYTTCRIFWDLNQVANFLARLGSFCEEMLHQIFIQLGEKYFDRDNYPTKWDFKFVKNDKDEKIFEYSKDEKLSELLKQPEYKIGKRLHDRVSKRKFAEALVIYRGKDLTVWQEIVQSLDNLEYWIGKRNEIIHSSQGVSKTTMAEVLAGDRKRYHKKYSYKDKDKDKDKDKKKALDAACDADKIISEMTKISRNTFELLGESSSPLLAYVGNKVDYYIYDEIAQWIRQQLNTQGLQ